MKTIMTNYKDDSDSDNDMIRQCMVKVFHIKTWTIFKSRT